MSDQVINTSVATALPVQAISALLAADVHSGGTLSAVAAANGVAVLAAAVGGSPETPPVPSELYYGFSGVSPATLSDGDTANWEGLGSAGVFAGTSGVPNSVVALTVSSLSYWQAGDNISTLELASYLDVTSRELDLGRVSTMKVSALQTYINVEAGDSVSFDYRYNDFASVSGNNYLVVTVDGTAFKIADTTMMANPYGWNTYTIFSKDLGNIGVTTISIALIGIGDNCSAGLTIDNLLIG